MKLISKKLALLEIAILEKKYDRALAILVEIFAIVVSLQADSPSPSIQWRPSRSKPESVPKRRSENDLICEVIRIAALASQRVPNATGETVCPKCGLVLNWSVHSTGRIFGSCESPRCLNFME